MQSMCSTYASNGSPSKKKVSLLDTGIASFTASCIAAGAALVAVFVNRRGTKEDKREDKQVKREEIQATVQVAQIEGAAEFRKELRDQIAALNTKLEKQDEKLDKQDVKLQWQDDLIETMTKRLDAAEQTHRHLQSTVDHAVKQLDIILARNGSSDMKAINEELSAIVQDLKKVLAARSGVIGDP